MLSFLENKWSKLSGHVRFSVKLSLCLGILLGLFLSMMGDATKLEGDMLSSVFLVLSLTSVAAYVTWLAFPLFSGIYEIVSSRNIDLKTVLSSIFGLSISGLSVYLFLEITSTGFVMYSSSPTFGQYLFIMYPSVLGALVLSVYYLVRRDSEPLRMNIHLLLGAIVVLSAVFTSFSTGDILDDRVDVERRGGMLLPESGCMLEIQQKCIRQDTIEDVPERCMEGEVLEEVEETYEIENGQITC